MTSYCAICGGELIPLGRLGRRSWYRCRDCGLDTSRESLTPTSDQDRALGRFMETHERAEVDLYRAGYDGVILRAEAEDGVVVQFDEAGREV